MTDSYSAFAQSLVSVRAGTEKQGEIQGVLASGMSLMMAITPLAATTVLQTSQPNFPGLVWCAVPLLYLLVLGFYLLRGRRISRDRPRSGIILI